MALALRHDARALPHEQVRRLALSSVPAAVAGLLLQGVVERRLGTTRGIATGLALGGAALWWADRRPAAPDPRPANGEPRWTFSSSTRGLGSPVAARSRRPAPSDRDLVAASLAQVVALAPGVSRTGATLTALRARGVDREDGLRTSLLMSLPITLGAAGLTAVRARRLPPVLPTAAAGITAYAATRHVRLGPGAVRVAVVYRLGVAAAALAHDRRTRR